MGMREERPNFDIGKPPPSHSCRLGGLNTFGLVLLDHTPALLRTDSSWLCTQGILGEVGARTQVSSGQGLPTVPQSLNTFNPGTAGLLLATLSSFTGTLHF